jgi:hypothetical protein
MNWAVDRVFTWIFFILWESTCYNILVSYIINRKGKSGPIFDLLSKRLASFGLDILQLHHLQFVNFPPISL